MREVVSQQEDTAGLRPSFDFAQDIRVTLEDSLMIFPLPDSGWGGRRESTGSTTAWITIRLRPSRLQVGEAVVASGELRFDLHNNMPEDVGVKLYFQDLVRGEMLELAEVISAESDTTVRLPLGGMILRPFTSGRREGAIRDIRGNMDVETIGLRFIAEQMVDWRFVPTPIPFRSLRGNIIDMRVPFETGPVEVALPSDFNGVTSATLEVSLSNAIAFTRKISMRVTAREDMTGGRTASLDLPAELGDLSEGKPDQPVLTTLRLDETNSNVLDLLNLKPATIEIAGDILLYGVREGQVSQSDRIDIQVAIRSPLEVAFAEHKAVSEPRNMGVNTVARGRIAKATGGTLTLDLANGLPVGVGLRLHLGTDTERLLESPALKIPRQGHISIGAAPIDATTGLVREPLAHREQITLTAAEAAVFSRSRLKSLMVITTEATNDRKVRIVDSDAVKMSIRARISVSE
ncbi:MAG: hypothetical protein OXR72_16360 [Gemmatimonadota bacterium]|nr:hypothetical protein [Gemmatimonadota bacterium]